MKYFIPFACFLLSTFCVLNNTKAQLQFLPPSFSLYPQNDEIYGACDIVHERYVFAADHFSYDSTGFVFITRQDGSILRSKYLFAKKDSVDFIPHHCFSNPDETITVIGQNVWLGRDNSFTNRLWAAKLDSNLNIISYKEYAYNSDTLKLVYMGPFVRTGKHFYGCIVYAKKSFYKYNFVKLIKMDEDGTIVHTQNLDSSFYGGTYEEFKGISSLCKGASPSELLLATEYVGYINRIDTNFNLIDTVSIQTAFGAIYSDTMLFLLGPKLAEVSSGNLIVGNRVNVAFYDEYIGVAKYDMNKKKIVKFGLFPLETRKTDSVRRGFNAANILKSGNALYASGYTDGRRNRNYIALAKYDTSGNPIWLQYYGDKIHYYQPRGLYACNDGSIMIYGNMDTSAKSSEYHNLKMDFFVMKIDGNSGFPLSFTNVSEQLRSGIILYPNPAQNEISFKGIKAGCKAVLYNMSGKLMMSQSLQFEADKINIAHLPSGTYTYSMVAVDGALLSKGIWVKN